MGKIIWEAYCKDCNKTLEACPNGEFTTAAGKRHEVETGHNIMIGYLLHDPAIKKPWYVPVQEADKTKIMSAAEADRILQKQEADKLLNEKQAWEKDDPTEVLTIWNSDGSKPCLITPPPKTLSNDFCSIEFEADNKQINGSDKTDQYNLPAFYTKSKRGIASSWGLIVRSFNKTTRMHDVLVMLQENGIRTHSWCMMD